MPRLHSGVWEALKPLRIRTQKSGGEVKRSRDTGPWEQGSQWFPFWDADGNHRMFLSSAGLTLHSLGNTRLSCFY